MADPDVWMRAAAKGDGEKYYEYDVMMDVVISGLSSLQTVSCSGCDYPPGTYQYSQQEYC